MKTIDIKILPKHFQESEGYVNHTGCPLALAIKEISPFGVNVSVSIDHVEVDGRVWRFDPLTYGSGKKFSAKNISEWCKNAKLSLSGIPTLCITLNESIKAECKTYLVKQPRKKRID